MRAITNSEYRAHTAPLFSKLEILDIFQVNTLDTAKFMFRYHNNLLTKGPRIWNCLPACYKLVKLFYL